MGLNFNALFYTHDFEISRFSVEYKPDDSIFKATNGTFMSASYTNVLVNCKGFY